MFISSLARETFAGHLANDAIFTEHGDSVQATSPNTKEEINIK